MRYQAGDFMELLRMKPTTNGEELFLRHEIANTRAEKDELYDDIEELHERYEIANAVEADKLYHEITIRQNVYDGMVEYIAECRERLDEIVSEKQEREREQAKQGRNA